MVKQDSETSSSGAEEHDEDPCGDASAGTPDSSFQQAAEDNGLDSELKHVVLRVLGQPKDGPMYKAFQEHGIWTILDLICLADQDIKNLTWTDEEKDGRTQYELNRGYQNLILAFLTMVNWRARDKNPIFDWDQLTKTEFNHFCMSVEYLAYRRGLDTPLGSAGSTSRGNTTSNMTTVTSIKTYTPIEYYRRNIKRDQDKFPTLKSPLQFNTWRRKMHTQADAQDLSKVLNPTYTPATQDDQDLFKEKQKFMLAVLEDKVQSDQGRKIVREHIDSGNAQLIFDKVVKHHTGSTAAHLDANKTYRYLMTQQLSSGTWKGSTSAFVLHWMEQCWHYEHVKTPIPDEQKLEMLPHAVSTVSELRAVKTNAEHLLTHSKKATFWEDYTALLLSAATTYDEAKSKMTGSVSSKWTIYAHEQTDPMHGEQDVFADAIETFDPDPDGFDMDSPIDTVQAYAANCSTSDRATFVQGDAWRAMTPQNREHWSKLSKEVKMRILGTLSDTSGGTPSPKKTGLGARVPCKANFHDLSLRNLLEVKLHDLASVSEEQHDNPSTDYDPSTSSHLIHAATRGTEGSVADIRNVLSQPSTKSTPTSGKPKAKANNHEISVDGKVYREVKNHEINVDGITYRQVNVHKVIYNVSVGDRTTSTASLVDRGANGGIAGDDVRVIHKLHRTVDVQGIDNHQMITISTVMFFFTRFKINSVLLKLLRVCHSLLSSALFLSTVKTS